MHIEPLMSVLLSLLNRNSGVDKQGCTGECGKLSERAQRFNMTATLLSCWFRVRKMSYTVYLWYHRGRSNACPLEKLMWILGR